MAGYLQLFLHDKVKFLENLSFSPHWSGPRFGVKNMLDVARLESFDSLVIQPNPCQANLVVQRDDLVIQAFHLDKLVPKVFGRNPSSYLRLWGIWGHLK